VPLAGGYSESIELCRSETACVMAKTHPLARKSEATPHDLADQRIISFADDTMTGWMLREAFRAKGVPFPIRIVTNQTLAACVLARKGVGVALVDTFPLLPNVPTDLAIVPFRPAIEFRPNVICPPGRPVSVVADQFINVLQATMKEMIRQTPFLRGV